MKPINEMVTLEEWNVLLEDSTDSPILVFKHSTSCMISARAFKHVQTFQQGGEDKMDCFMVKVIESRRLSNEIARDTKIPHKSPQILLINNQQVVWNTSHWKITEHRLRQAVRKYC
ncbi:bacillithiol system redox-active protein YtxJ [Ornithinibacillus xuwenensis]|uniref:Bacillithiol system redox-active protein YtxJ n=1 Tax=Ornithinibacillus xuwenensis TaxID=3144668 RepID=A0ABU9XCV3_9BACI